MKRTLLVLAALLLVGCSTPKRETWIGSNVDVTVDSFAGKQQAQGR
jgi:hypothetical protein